MKMLKTNSMLMLIFCILAIACFLMGCVEKPAESNLENTWSKAERTDMFTLIGHQHLCGSTLAVYHYNVGNVTIFATDDGLAAIPDYELNRSQDYSVVIEALELNKIKN
ncbi:MAG: hypothetical protein M0P26_01030 [Bacteroidales bacterium]|nr:hypothetical protein [Bacteroidales bacterium]